MTRGDWGGQGVRRAEGEGSQRGRSRRSGRLGLPLEQLGGAEASARDERRGDLASERCGWLGALTRAGARKGAEGRRSERKTQQEDALRKEGSAPATLRLGIIRISVCACGATRSSSIAASASRRSERGSWLCGLCDVRGSACAGAAPCGGARPRWRAPAKCRAELGEDERRRQPELWIEWERGARERGSEERAAASDEHEEQCKEHRQSHRAALRGVARKAH